MTSDEKEIFDDLYRLIEKMASMEEAAGKQIFTYDVLDNISYAMEGLSGMKGTTERIKQKRQEQLTLLNKANN